MKHKKSGSGGASSSPPKGTVNNVDIFSFLSQSFHFLIQCVWHLSKYLLKFLNLLCVYCCIDFEVHLSSLWKTQFYYLFSNFQKDCYVKILKQVWKKLSNSTFSMTQLSLHTFTHLTGPSFRVKAKLLPNKFILSLV